MADVTLSALIDTFLQEGALDATQKDSIREDLGLKTTDAVTFKNLILTALSLTGSQATGSVDIAATWNTTGTPTAFKINITDTASNAASLLMDLQVGGTSKFKVSKDGVLTLANGAAAAPSIRFDSNIGIYGVNSTLVGVSIGTALAMSFGTGQIWMRDNASELVFGSSADLRLFRKAAASLQMGLDHATSATNQTLKAHNVTTGTGADLILSGGTGSVASGKVRTSTLGVFTLGPYTERIALTYSATLTPNCNDGLSRSVAMTGDQVINAPTNGVSGMILTLKMLASGADRELTFHSDIKKPTGSTYEATVASGSTRVIQLEYNGTAWMLIKNLEFVA